MEDRATIKATYPLPIYNYRVTLHADGKSQVIAFSEVSGLTIEYEPITYKHGLSFATGHNLITGQQKPIQIMLKKGVVKDRSRVLIDWFTKTHSDPLYSAAKRHIEIDLCDESAEPLIRWTVRDALPIKLRGPTFDASSNDVAIDELELIAHSLHISYDP